MKKIFEALKLNKKKKGSLTVEAAMIFPLIMFVMFAIIYLTIVHYQNNVMIAESIRAMNRAGAYWQYADMDKFGKKIENTASNTPAPFDSSLPHNGIINIEMIKNRNAYRTIIDVVSEAISKVSGSAIGGKKVNTKQYVDANVSGVQFKQYRDSDNKDTISDVLGEGFMFFGDDLGVEVGRAYINPLLRLSKLFLGSNSAMERAMKKDIKVSSIISNQAEFIRNIDTVYDLGSNIYNLVVPKKDGD